MGEVDVALMRANHRFAKQDFDKQMVRDAGAGSASYGDCGPPNWHRASWEAFRAQYGKYPYTASELPPTFLGAPPWVYEFCGLRQPPVTVNPT